MTTQGTDSTPSATPPDPSSGREPTPAGKALLDVIGEALGYPVNTEPWISRVVKVERDAAAAVEAACMERGHLTSADLVEISREAAAIERQRVVERSERLAGAVESLMTMYHETAHTEKLHGCREYSCVEARRLLASVRESRALLDEVSR